MSKEIPTEQKFNEEERNRKLEIQDAYLKAREEYYEPFNEFVLYNMPDAEDVLKGGYDLYNSNLKTYRFAFAQYDDANALNQLCIENGFNTEIVEPARNAVLPKGHKCFAVRLKPFMSKDDFEKDYNRQSNR